MSQSGMSGRSPRNAKYMRTFAEEYLNNQFVQQVAGQIGCFSLALLDGFKGCFPTVEQMEAERAGAL